MLQKENENENHSETTKQHDLKSQQTFVQAKKEMMNFQLYDYEHMNKHQLFDPFGAFFVYDSKIDSKFEQINL